MGSSIYQPTRPAPALAGLGEQLAQFFDALTAAPLPPHMADLVEQLEQTYAAGRRDVLVAAADAEKVEA